MWAASVLAQRLWLREMCREQGLLPARFSLLSVLLSIPGRKKQNGPAASRADAAAKSDVPRQPRAKKPKLGEVQDSDSIDQKKPEVTAQAHTQTQTQTGTETQTQASAAVTHDDADPVELLPAAHDELGSVTQQLESAHLKDPKEAEAEEEQVQEPAPTSGTASASSSGAAPAGHPTQAAKFGFSSRTGLSNFSAAKRKMVCLTCNQPIHVGDYRFEHYFGVKRPPRSLHPGCVGQIAPETLEPSLNWLRHKVVSCTDKEQRDILSDSLGILETMSAVALSQARPVPDQLVTS